MDSFCVCCGAETDRDGHHAMPIEESVCACCALELDALRLEHRLDEMESIERFRLGA